jgi:hypothetical protein
MGLANRRQTFSSFQVSGTRLTSADLKSLVLLASSPQFWNGCDRKCSTVKPFGISGVDTAGLGLGEFSVSDVASKVRQALRESEAKHVAKNKICLSMESPDDEKNDNFAHFIHTIISTREFRFKQKQRHDAFENFYFQKIVEDLSIRTAFYST